MTYSLLILRRAQKELSELPEAAYKRVKLIIQKLGDEPRPRGSRKLSGREGWRIRLGEYRIIYEIDKQQSFCDYFTYWPPARCLPLDTII